MRDEVICISRKDILDSLYGEDFTNLQIILNKIKKNSSYLCIDTTKPYIDEINEIIQKYEQKEIIAFIGRAGSGKDYQCKLLEQKGYTHLAFADGLRNIAFNSLNIDKDLGLKCYDYLKENNCISTKILKEDGNIQEQNINFRQYLEYLGTQGIRKYDNDFWCKCLIKQLIDNNCKKVCISDMRFLNEYYYLSRFAEDNEYNFKVIFCDYHSDRYQVNNDHKSAELSNWFANNGYKDLQEITKTDMEVYNNIS